MNIIRIFNKLIEMVPLTAFLLLTIPLANDKQAQEYIVGVEDVASYPLFEYQSDRNTFSRKLLNKFAASKGYIFISSN